MYEFRKYGKIGWNRMMNTVHLNMFKNDPSEEQFDNNFIYFS